MATYEKQIIDIHTHILPAVDDGAESMEMTLEMLKLAYRQGVRGIIATPHFDRQQNHAKETLQKLTEQVAIFAKEQGTEYSLYLGNELYYEEGCLEALKQKQVCTMANSRYVLVEFSPGEAYQTMYTGMQDFILEGYCPIIAHMERYSCLWKKKERLRSLLDLGCYLQVNADSFLGGFLNAEAAYVKKLVREGYIHFIASDCHNLTSRRSRLEECYKVLEKTVGEVIVRKIFYENPNKMLENKYI